jgi:hypothetical protein
LEKNKHDHNKKARPKFVQKKNFIYGFWDFITGGGGVIATRGLKAVKKERVYSKISYISLASFSTIMCDYISHCELRAAVFCFTNLPLFQIGHLADLKGTVA